MTKMIHTAGHSATSHPGVLSIAPVLAALRSAWRRASNRLAAAEQAAQLAELTDRQLLDCGLGDALAGHRYRVAVDGALMRRLMSLG
jgi:hypothetical protein